MIKRKPDDGNMSLCICFTCLSTTLNSTVSHRAFGHLERPGPHGHLNAQVCSVSSVRCMFTSTASLHSLHQANGQQRPIITLGGATKLDDGRETLPKDTPRLLPSEVVHAAKFRIMMLGDAILRPCDFVPNAKCSRGTVWVGNHAFMTLLGIRPSSGTAVRRGAFALSM